MFRYGRYLFFLLLLILFSYLASRGREIPVELHTAKGKQILKAPFSHKFGLDFKGYLQIGKSRVNVKPGSHLEADKQGNLILQEGQIGLKSPSEFPALIIGTLSLSSGQGQIVIARDSYQSKVAIQLDEGQAELSFPSGKITLLTGEALTFREVPGEERFVIRKKEKLKGLVVEVQQ